ncbi:14909_t:CDS:2 [Cetraspora pellucida]|uniref:14909_t:CDS:1 n=1 Tax=Cetraspora pellucida TaxID=1433469 RepID=A0A9N9NH82_9GLOM|nr:14909_t:CDS:2 [Cetraspora pellucida]
MPLSVHRIALNFDVTGQTLHDAIAQGSAPKCPGPSTILTAEEENELVEYCLNMQRIGFKLTRAAINTMIVQMLKIKNKEYLLKNAWLRKVLAQKASGMCILSLLVYKGVNVIKGLLDNALVLSSIVATFTNTDYMHENIFGMYIEHFNNSILSTRPVLLMLDGATSHINLISIKYYNENNILLYVLSSNTTHILQPSKTFIKKLKAKYDKASDCYHSNNDYEVVTKYSFAQVFDKAFYETYTLNAIRHTFAATGIWLLNLNAINSDRLMPSLPTYKLVITS